MSGAEPPGPGMRFAESQLRRHGWRRGQGLGKREDGIAEAIRVRVKCGTAGVGHDAAEPFSFHWWDHVFNAAAANVAVEAGQDGVSMKRLSEQGVGISTRKPRKAGGAGSLLYGRFVKSATLTAHGEEPTTLPPGSGSEEEEDEEKLDRSSASRLTDEELMRACGGRTAHKGARHGLTMSAKLARLEEQERAFLAAYRQRERPPEPPEPPERSPAAEGQEKKKKRKGKSCGDGVDPKTLHGQEPSGEEEAAGEEEKVVKRKKKKKKQEENVDKQEAAETKKRKKKHKAALAGTEDKELAEIEVPLEDTDGPDQAGRCPRKKRKKRKREAE